MAGINPATGKFDPLYYGAAKKPKTGTPKSTTTTGSKATFDPIHINPGKTNWVLPVAGMRKAPGDRAQGGNWARGSFGYQKPASKGGHVHQGVDIYADAGAAILAPVSGTIMGVGSGTKSGNYVRIKGTDGIIYYFAHMQDASPWSQGAKVQAGTYIGAVGNTGNASGTSPHLHFSMSKGGRPVSPNAFLETGRQQQHTPLSAIPGLNTPEEVQAWAIEESRRQQEAHAQMGEFDVSGLPEMAAGQRLPGKNFGKSFMSTMMDGFSRRVSGGEARVPIPRTGPMLESSALDASTGADTAGVPTEEAVHPVMQRQDVTGG